MKAVTVFIVDQRDDKEALDFARAAVFEKNEHLDYARWAPRSGRAKPRPGSKANYGARAKPRAPYHTTNHVRFLASINHPMTDSTPRTGERFEGICITDCYARTSQLSGVPLA